MSDTYELTLHGLLRKRGEMSSQIEGLRGALSQALADLDHIEAAIRIFNPNIGADDMPERPAPPPSAAFRGEVQRFLLYTLRTYGEPLRTAQLAHAVMANRNLSTADRVLTKLIEKRTSHSLARLRKQGFVESIRYGKGAELEWRLTGRDEQPGGWRNGTQST